MIYTDSLFNTLSVSESSKKATIWDFASHYPRQFDTADRLYIQEEFTPVFHLATGDPVLDSIIFKREDESICGSHKFRSLCYQMSRAKSDGAESVVISTSGNAGIAAAMIGNKYGILVTIFCAEDTDKVKLQKMSMSGAKIILSKRPIRMAKYFSTKMNVPNLRPSKDVHATIGYVSLAGEIIDQVPSAEMVFTYVTSGTSLEGMALGYDLIQKRLPEFHVVQSGPNVSVAALYEPERDVDLSSLAGKNVPGLTTRKDAVLSILGRSKGRGWMVDDEELLSGRMILDRYGISTSFEGVASFCSAYRYLREADKLRDVVVVLSGRNWGVLETDVSYERADEFEEVNALL
jgi:threonine dehydratase